MSAPTLDALSATTISDYIPLIVAAPVAVAAAAIAVFLYLPERKKMLNRGRDTTSDTIVMTMATTVVVAIVIGIGTTFSPGMGVTEAQASALREHTAGLGLTLTDRQLNDVITGLRNETSPTLLLATGGDVRDVVFTTEGGRVVVATTTSHEVLRPAE